MAKKTYPGASSPAPDLRSDAEAWDALLTARLDCVLPRAMAAADLDVWVVLGREYAEGAVLRSMLPGTWLSARRLTALVLQRDRATGRVRREAVSRYGVGDAFPAAWDPERQPDQWARVAELVCADDPQRVGVDSSAVLAHGDGLSATDAAALRAALPDTYRERLVSADRAAAVWLGTRLPEEVSTLREATRRGHAYLARALSTEAVTPGHTTTHDLEWWLRQRVHDDGLGSWFHPSVRVQRRDGAAPVFAAHPGQEIIQPGDLLHIDFGIVLRGLCTDQQQHGYVLRPGESQPPRELVAALAVGNRLQELLVHELRPGRTGDEVLAATRRAARSEGIEPQVYSHPLGLQGHGAGPAVGLWDQQEGVPGTGGLVVDPDTCWSVELAAHVPATVWPQDRVSVMLEEDLVLTDDGADWLDGRQTALHVIGG